MKIKSLFAKLALATAIGCGTFYGTSMAPLLTKRENAGCGIQIGLASGNISEFYGIQASGEGFNFGTNYGANVDVVGANGGKIYGANLALVANLGSIDTEHSPIVYGLECALGCNGFYKNGRTEIHGLQAALFFNQATEDSRGAQVGLVNCVYNNENKLIRWNLLLNIMNGKNKGDKK